MVRYHFLWVCRAAAAVRNAEPEVALFKCLCCCSAKELSPLGPVEDLWVYVHISGLCCPEQSSQLGCSKLLSGAGVMLCWDTRVFLRGEFNWCADRVGLLYVNVIRGSPSWWNTTVLHSCLLNEVHSSGFRTKLGRAAVCILQESKYCIYFSS